VELLKIEDVTLNALGVGIGLPAREPVACILKTDNSRPDPNSPSFKT
jgi:hypothetical protein